MKASSRYSEYVRKIKCGEWEEVATTNHTVVLRHIPTGQTVAYGTHDGGNDLNGPRNFAADVQRICGCKLIEARGRKRSRKSPFQRNEAVEAQRRKFRAAAAERERAQAQQERERKELEQRSKQAASLRRRLVVLALELEHARAEFVRARTDPRIAQAFASAQRAYAVKRAEYEACVNQRRSA